MRSGELAKLTGVEIDTIRYYEKSGLLPPPPRRGNGYREYGEQHIERLAFIRHCRALDMPLIYVQRLLDFVAHPDADCGDINRLIDSQLQRVRKRLESMHALETQLAALRKKCDEHSTARECGILHDLVVAAHDEGAVRH